MGFFNWKVKKNDGRVIDYSVENSFEGIFKNYLTEQNRVMNDDTRQSIGPCYFKIILEENEPADAWLKIPVTGCDVIDGKLKFHTGDALRTHDEHGDKKTWNDTVNIPTELARSHNISEFLTFNPIEIELYSYLGGNYSKIANNSGEISGIEGNAPYIDSNDTIGQFSYTMGFTGYEADVHLADSIKNISNSVGENIYSKILNNIAYKPKYIILSSDNIGSGTQSDTAYIIDTNQVTNVQINPTTKIYNHDSDLFNELVTAGVNPSYDDIKQVGTVINISSGSGHLDTSAASVSCTFSDIDIANISLYVHFVFTNRVVQVDHLDADDGSLATWNSGDGIVYTYKW